MILLIIWDGLRPDAVTAETAPFLHRMANRGVFCRNSHAVFPTSTRINSASLTTGCYPGRHGIVDNELYIPALNAREVVSCADWRALKALAEEGCDPVYGARPLKRVIQRKIENIIANELLSGGFENGETVEVSVIDYEITVRLKGSNGEQRAKGAE